MNKDILEGKWAEAKGKLLQKWGELTEDDIKAIEGQYDQLIGKIQQRYGYQKHEAEKQVNKFLDENFPE